jgi:hypothetical protein
MTNATDAERDEAWGLIKAAVEMAILPIEEPIHCRRVIF